MIKVNELRIGNLVYFLGNVHEIEGISKRLRPDVGHFQLSGVEYSQKGFHLKPLQLTEDWLIKLGFNKLRSDIRYWQYGSLKIKVTENGFKFMYGGNVLYIKYVHSLQNLYFELSGNDFNVK